MKICITAKGNKINSEFDECFCSSPYYLLLDDETCELLVLRNTDVPFEAKGIKIEETLIENDIDILITGRIGHAALRRLERESICVRIVRESKKVIDMLKNNYPRIAIQLCQKYSF